MPQICCAAFFVDGFESGNLSHTENGAYWYGGSYQYATASTTRARTGSYSMRFMFGPNIADVTEERYNLGSNKTDVWIKYYLWLDSNFLYGDDADSDNNKFIRIWGDDYNDKVKNGASFFYKSGASPYAEIQLETASGSSDVLGCNYEMSQVHTWGTWVIDPSDLGRWVAVKWHFKVDDGTGNGAIELYVDDSLVAGRTEQSWADAPCGPGYFRNGYLFGATNYEYLETWYAYIDDVIMADSDPDASSDVTPPANPSGLSVT